MNSVRCVRAVSPAPTFRVSICCWRWIPITWRICVGSALTSTHTNCGSCSTLARIMSGKTYPTPDYGGPQGFEHVLDLIETGTRALLNALDQDSA